MAGSVKYVRGLENRSGRMKLKPGAKVYWRAIIGPLALGYQRRNAGAAGRWIIRSYVGDGKYRETAITLADDYEASDGSGILTFAEASEKVRQSHRTGQEQPAALHERISRKALSFIEQNIEPKGYLYRHFGPDGDLLYVGQSIAPLARNGAHLKTANWKTQISIIAIEPFATREEALAAEELAIRTEHPKHNEAHNKPRHPLRELRRLDRSHQGERAAGME